MLKAQTAYMLRNDGQVFECDLAHPYILYQINDNFRVNIYDLIVNQPQSLTWFYDHTNQSWIKNKIKECLQYLADAFENETIVDLYYYLGIEQNDLQDILNIYNIQPRKLAITIDKKYIQTCEALFQDLNDKCNQEFLRFRTSDMYYGSSGNGIYFRVSSYGFNWFNLIWKIVYENRNWISDVTIVADKQSGKNDPKLYYNLNGPVNKVLTNDFIWLKGNPIVEQKYSIDYDILDSGGTLLEVLGDYGPFHNHRKFTAELNNYLQKNFTQLKN